MRAEEFHFSTPTLGPFWWLAMPSAWFDDVVARHERANSHLVNERRMVEDIHDRSDNLLYILYAAQEHCEEIAVRIDELGQE